MSDCHPHRFQHTSAINSLRDEGNWFELTGKASWADVRHHDVVARLIAVDEIAATARRANVLTGNRCAGR